MLQVMQDARAGGLTCWAEQHGVSEKVEQMLLRRETAYSQQQLYSACQVEI